jgi:DNA-binding NarL/FixJ family response regulator
MRASTSEASSSTVTVCLVEDHVQVRDELVDLLTHAGMHVLSAVGTVRDGQKSVTDCRPDVAVIDNNLPDGRGIDLCRALAKSAPDVTLLIHTGVVTSDVEREALNAGATAVIRKGLRGDELIRAIRNRPYTPWRRSL